MRSDGYTEWTILLAIAGILLSAGDAIVGWLLAVLAPALASRFDALDKGRRVLIAGAPSATIFLAAAYGAQRWSARRHRSLGR